MHQSTAASSSTSSHDAASNLKWKKYLNLLKTYKRTYGHVNVPEYYKTTSGKKLGRWVHGLRIAGLSTLDISKRRRLEQLGFQWILTDDEDDDEDDIVELNSKAIVSVIPDVDDTMSKEQINLLCTDAEYVTEDMMSENEHDVDTGVDVDASNICATSKQILTTIKESEHIDRKLVRTNECVGNVKAAKKSSANLNRLNLSSNWEHYIGVLKLWKQKHGHCRVPQRFITDSGDRLGHWVHRVRHVNVIPQLYRSQLDDLGFIWDPLEDTWNRNFAALVAFKQERGHCMVPRSYKAPTGELLGHWVHGVRMKTKENSEREKMLDELGFTWVTSRTTAANAIAPIWNSNMASLKAYRKKHGNCLVPKNYVDPSGFKLAYWVSRLRNLKHTLPPERRVELDSMGFVWEARSSLSVGRIVAWKDNIAKLRAYKEEHNDCLVPRNFKTPCGMFLGRWVQDIRVGELIVPPEHREQLDELEFEWSTSVKATNLITTTPTPHAPASTLWDLNINLLKAYKAKYDHILVPSEYITPCGKRLGELVGDIRCGAIDVTGARPLQLNDIGFVWMPSTDDNWACYLITLTSYKQTYGDCRVSEYYVAPSGVALGTWVTSVRSLVSANGPHALEPAEAWQKLDALGFVWDLLKDDFIRNIVALESFHDEYGTCEVPYSYKTPAGEQLGRWVNRIRCDGISQLTSSFSTRLNRIGFVWDSIDTYEEYMVALEEYKRKYGNSAVPSSFITKSGIRLGEWVRTIRFQGRSGLSLTHRIRLERLSFVWNEQDNWDRNILLLMLYRAEYGNSRVPHHFVAPSGENLGFWVHSLYVCGPEKLSRERRSRLQAIGFSWNNVFPSASSEASNEQIGWENMLEELTLYKQKHGDCSVPSKRLSDGDGKLRVWVKQLRGGGSAVLSPARRLDLQRIGFRWKEEDSMESHMTELETYHREFGDYLVASDPPHSLNDWLVLLREQILSKKPQERISDRRFLRLNKLGFVWDPVEASKAKQWKRNLASLHAYREAYGDCLVDEYFVSFSGEPLGSWVHHLRRKRPEALSHIHQKQLESLGFVWDNRELQNTEDQNIKQPSKKKQRRKKRNVEDEMSRISSFLTDG